MYSGHYIYRHIRPDTNEVFYIGQGREGSRREFDRRHNNLWTKIVEKNSGEYRVQIMLEGLTQEEANVKEKEFIELYGFKKNGSGTLANLLVGGKGEFVFKMPVDRKEELRKSMIGNKHAVGTPWTEERRQRHILARLGKSTAKKGQKHSEETRRKMSLGHRGNTATLGRIAITDGEKKKLIKRGDPIPDGWILGAPKRNKIEQIK